MKSVNAAANDRFVTIDDITGAIIDESLKIHRALGPGLLESVYEALLTKALERRGLFVERQKVVQFEYDGIVKEGLHRIVNGYIPTESSRLQVNRPLITDS